MPDRDKVIRGLECCMSEHICRGCPYREKDECEDGGYYYSKAIEDALALLREQEPVEPKASEWLEDSDPGQEYGTTWACRKCMYSIHKPYIWNPYDFGYKYCFHCGARMEVTLDADKW